MSTVDKMINSMPHPVLTKNQRVATYKSIKFFNNKLTGNDVTIATNLGCGMVGYAQLTLTPAAYTNISNVRWTAPTNHGV